MTIRLHRARVAPVALLAFAFASAAERSPSGELTGPVEMLVAEALAHNQEIAAARAERDAAGQRIAPAGALEDPMLEAGIVNAPLPFSLRRDDMTMKMLGLSQKLPFPGKRGLRRDVADADSKSVTHALDETTNRVVRDIRVAYEGLRFTLTSRRLVTETVETVTQLASLATSRYAVGQATQSDALQAQVEVVRLQQELLRLGQEETMRRSELRRLLGRHGEDTPPIVVAHAVLLELPAPLDRLQALALEQRPQLKSLAALVERNERAVDLARRDYFPDFEVRLGYGQRERTLDGMPRDDMVTLTVAVNLPLWRKDRLEPRVAEATALRLQAVSLAENQRLDTQAMLETEVATEQQQRASAALYRTTLLPQTEAAFESAMAAYRVGRADFLTLLESRRRVFETALGEAQAIAEHNKAIAEIEFLIGNPPLPSSPEAQP